MRTVRVCRRGFTLIELLVVIAVIALLIGVLVPALGAARGSARTIESMAAARSLMQAYVAYTVDHNDAVLPAHLRTGDPGEAWVAQGVIDEFGNELSAPVNQRWAYRLGQYFEYGWAGTTHVGSRAELLKEKAEILSGDAGTQDWAYQVSVFPSFGINRRYVGGDYRRDDWIEQKLHVVRLSRASQPSNLVVFASARFSVGPLEYDGYLDIDPPPVGAVYDEKASTASPLTAFGRVHLRHQGRAVVGWLDGHAGALDEQGVLDRRNWSDAARLSGDREWEAPDE